MTMMEKKFAYGFKARFVDNATVMLKLSADLGREIKVGPINGTWHAIVNIDGHSSILDRIFVKSVEKKLWPSVEYVELFGVDAKSGESRHERIYP